MLYGRKRSARQTFGDNEPCGWLDTRVSLQIKLLSNRALSRPAVHQVCDADELGALLRIKLGINESDADGGYKDTLFASSTGTEQPVPATGAEKGAVDEVSFSVQAGGGAGPAEPGEAGIEEAAAAVAGEHSAIITRAPTASVAAEDEEDGEEKGEAEARRGRRGLLPRASAGVPAGGGAAATTAAGARLLSSSSARRHSIPPQLEETGGRSRAFVLHRSKL